MSFSITTPSTRVWCIKSFDLYPEIVQEYQIAEQERQDEIAEQEQQDEIVEQEQQDEIDEQDWQDYQYEIDEQEQQDEIDEQDYQYEIAEQDWQDWQDEIAEMLRSYQISERERQDEINRLQEDIDSYHKRNQLLQNDIREKYQSRPEEVQQGNIHDLLAKVDYHNNEIKKIKIAKQALSHEIATVQKEATKKYPLVEKSYYIHKFSERAHIYELEMLINELVQEFDIEKLYNNIDFESLLHS